jgi:hypothetical protein
MDSRLQYPPPGTRAQVGQDLDHWLSSAGLEGALATPARTDLRRVWAAAAEAQQLRRQMDALREAELDMAAREASETARNLGLLVRIPGSVCVRARA